MKKKKRKSNLKSFRSEDVNWSIGVKVQMPISNDVVNVRFIRQLHVMIKKKGENNIMFRSS